MSRDELVLEGQLYVTILRGSKGTTGFMRKMENFHIPLLERRKGGTQGAHGADCIGGRCSKHCFKDGERKGQGILLHRYIE